MKLSSTPDATLITRLAYTTGLSIEYIGSAAPSSATSEDVWKITKIIYDANENITEILFAEGTKHFDKIWDDRASYNYS